MLLCSSSLRPPLSLGPDRILRLANEAGFAGIAADRDISLALLPRLATEGLRSGAPVSLVSCPIPAEELSKGRRLPHLVAVEDPDERLAAVKLGRQALSAAGELSIPVILLDLGPVPLSLPESRLRLYFSRREMADDEPGRKYLQRVLQERKARGMSLFDAARASLEPLLEQSAQRGTTLVLSIAASPWQLPSPREAELLLREFAGAPLAVALSPARQAILEALRLGGPRERWPDLARASRVLQATDQVGLDGDLLLGLGELDLVHRLPSPLPEELLCVVGGPSDSTFKEILRARRLLEQALPAPPDSTSGPSPPTSLNQ